MKTDSDAKTILVVDDDRELNDGLREVLIREGYNIIQASNGIQARDLIFQARPDLVILDMMMPRMGGFPILEHFRGKADAPPIIMITANEGSRHKAYAGNVGCGQVRPETFSDGCSSRNRGSLLRVTKRKGGRNPQRPRIDRLSQNRVRPTKPRAI